MSPLVQCHQWKLQLHQQGGPDLDPAALTSRTWLEKEGSRKIEVASKKDRHSLPE